MAKIAESSLVFKKRRKGCSAPGRAGEACNNSFRQLSRLHLTCELAAQSHFLQHEPRTNFMFTLHHDVFTKEFPSLVARIELVFEVSTGLINERIITLFIK